MTYDYEPGSVPLFNGSVVMDHVGTRWRFKRPIKFFYAVMPDYTLYVESMTLDIIAEGRSWMKLYKDLDEELTHAWEEYALADPDTLHQSGIKLKKALLDNVEFIGEDLHGDTKA